jgi:hypothetical protein
MPARRLPDDAVSLVAAFSGARERAALGFGSPADDRRSRLPPVAPPVGRTRSFAMPLSNRPAQSSVYGVYGCRRVDVLAAPPTPRGTPRRDLCWMDAHDAVLGGERGCRVLLARRWASGAGAAAPVAAAVHVMPAGYRGPGASALLFVEPPSTERRVRAFVLPARMHALPLAALLRACLLLAWLAAHVRAARRGAGGAGAANWNRQHFGWSTAGFRSIFGWRWGDA